MSSPSYPTNYICDGGGRDGYIHHYNGGFLKQTKLAHVPFSPKKDHVHIAFSKQPFPSKPMARYTAGGGGRDTFLLNHLETKNKSFVTDLRYYEIPTFGDAGKGGGNEKKTKLPKATVSKSYYRAPLHMPDKEVHRRQLASLKRLSSPESTIERLNKSVELIRLPTFGSDFTDLVDLLPGEDNPMLKKSKKKKSPPRELEKLTPKEKRKLDRSKMWQNELKHLYEMLEDKERRNYKKQLRLRAIRNRPAVPIKPLELGGNFGRYTI